MKKITLRLLVTLLLLGIISAKAQIENFYTFSESTEAYTPLVGADETILIPFTFSQLSIPFDFEFAGKKASFAFFNTWGTLNIGGSGTSVPQPNELSDNGQQNLIGTSIIAPLWDTGIIIPQNNTTAKRKTLLEGTAPNRTYTVEWENVLWKTVGSEVSFRVIFEETTNNITFLYGPNMSIENQSASIGINTEFGSNVSFLSVTPGAIPTVSNTIANNAISTSEYPGEGKSYKFTYTPPNCKIPSELTIDQNSLTPFTAEASWVNADTEAEWDILIINQNDQTSSTVTATTNPFTLSNLTEDTRYSIAIRANCQTDGMSEYSLLSFFTTPAVCPKPLSLTVNNITLDSADFMWTTGDQETAWEVAVVASEDPEPTSGTMVSTTDYNAAGLIKDTDYILYVRADCGGTDGFSKWSTVDFRTLATCQAPTNVTISNEGCSSVDVSWTANNSETSWEILVQTLGNSEEYTVLTNTNPFTLENLSSVRTYRIFVRSICAADDISRYSVRSFGKPLPDNELPIAIAKNITVELDETGNVTIMPSDLDNGSTDNCGISEMRVQPNNFFNCSQIGENNVQLLVQDFGFNSDTAPAIVTVEDNISPSAIAKDFTAQLDASGSVTIVGGDIDNGSTDNCTIRSITVLPNTFDCSHIGNPQSVVLTVTDTAGNSDTAMALVTIEDAISPNAISKNFTTQLDASGNVTVLASDINNGSVDNCTISSITVTPNTFDCSHIGAPQSVTLTVADSSGNIGTSNAIVTIEDTISPNAISKNFTAQLDAFGNVTVLESDINNGSVDNCTISSITVTPNTFDCSHIGVPQSVTLTVTDSGGNIDTSTSIVTVEDTMLPQANCVAPFVIQLDESGNTTITATDINNGSTDNCVIDILSIDKTTFTTSDIGENIIALTITDQSGNTSMCTTTVTIEAAPVSLEDYVTGLSSPRGLAFDTNGDLYIAEHFSGKIFKVTSVETSSEFAATGFRNNNISFDSNGILYTTDDFISQIFQIDSQGSESVYLNSSNGISSPWGITFDTNGNLYYSNQFGGKVIKVTPDLTSSDYATGFFNAEGIAFDSNGNLFIADRSDRKLIKVESDGTQTTVLSGIADIRAVTVDSENNVYFNRTTGSGSSSVVKIIKYNQTDASQIEIISNGLTRVNELAFNRDGDLFIAQDDKVSVIRGVAASEVLSTEEFIENKLAFYPNPVINNLYFSEVVQSLKIYDLSGKKVFESRNSGKDFDISKLASGLYIIEIKNNNQSIVKKMIKDF